MNPLGIIAIIIALAVGYFGLTANDGRPFGGGPLATGPGTAEIRNPQPVNPAPAAPPPSPVTPPPAPQWPPRDLKPGESPYRGLIRITNVQRSGDRPDQEHVVLRYSGTLTGQPARIEVTGWRISSLRGSEPIPAAFNIPEIDATEQSIIVPSGGETVIVTGIPSYETNFRENGCGPYFAETNSFTPSLSASCIETRPSSPELLALGFNGACIDTIQSQPTCRTPRGPFIPAEIKSECIDYMNKNFSYVGCVANYRNRKDFLKNAWRVSLRRGEKLFDPRHDRVALRDRQGLLVDEFEY